MEIKKIALLEALTKCLPGVETGNSLLTGADTFVFSDGHIYAYNDTISVSIPFVLNNDQLIPDAAPVPFTGSVKATEFFKLISKMPGEVIQADCQDDKTWALKAGKVKVELKLLESEIAARVKGLMTADMQWGKLPEVFATALQQCHISGNRESLSGIFCADDVMISTDKMSINVANLGSDFLPVDVQFWIAQESGLELSKIKELAEYSLTTNWAHFKSAHGVVFSAKRLMHDNYPYKVLADRIKGMVQRPEDLTGALPIGLAEALERAAVFSVDLESRNLVKLAFTPAGVEVSSQRNAGKFFEEVPWDIEMPSDFAPITMDVDFNMVRYGLKKSKTFYIHAFTGNDGKQKYRVVFTGEGITHYMSTFVAN